MHNRTFKICMSALAAVCLLCALAVSGFAEGRLPAEGSLYVTDQRLENAQYIRIEDVRGNSIQDAVGNLTLQLTDSRLNLDHFSSSGALPEGEWGKNIHVQLKSDNYVMANIGVVLDKARSQSSGSLSFTVLIPNMVYIGGADNILVLEVSYPGLDPDVTPPEIAAIGVDFPQFRVEVRPDPTAAPTAEPTATPAPTPEPTAEPVYRTPGIIIKSSSAGTNQVEAGQDFTLTLTVFATTGNENLSDVLVALTLPENVMLAEGNLNQYVGSLGPQSTRDVYFRLKTGSKFTGGVANIGVSLTAQGQQSGTPTTGSSSVSVPVVQPERFEITNVEAPETLMVGEEGYLSVTFVNKGKEEISNLSAEISGTNLQNPGQSQFLGNIAAGTENSVDFDLIAQQAGPMQCTVILSYEDNTGAVKTMSHQISCTAEEAMFEDTGMYEEAPMEEQPTGGKPWLLFAILGVAAVGVGVLLWRRHKKKAAAAEDEDDWEDEEFDKQPDEKQAVTVPDTDNEPAAPEDGHEGK